MYRFELICALKVPHKSKKYDQFYLRTMFFPREDTVTIDGVTYEIANAIKVETWNSKGLIVNDIMPALNVIIEDMESANFMDYKKKLVTKLKEFDKQYMKHIKKTHPDVQEIISAAIQPMLDILESNYNFHKIEELIKKGHEIPSFRFEALEDKFCEHMEVICTILKEHGNLKDTFAIKRMLNLLKLDNWEEIVPMKFYLTPLKDSIKKVRDEIIDMRKKGQNRVKYYVENNQPMHNLIIDMVAKDVTAQWLMGDKLKNDQLCFLYEVIKTVHKSPLRPLLEGNNKVLVTEVIPKMACFRALLVIKDILTVQTEEKKQEKKNPQPEAEDEAKEGEGEGDAEESASPNKDLTEEEEEYRKDQEIKKKEKEEMEKYGRKWIWQGYISENRKENWTEAAETLRHINDHVIQDIQDYIMIQAYGKKAEDRKKINTDVEQLLVETENAKSGDETKPGKIATKKRQFEMSHRPPYVWNFFETRADHEEKMRIQNQKETYPSENDTEEEPDPKDLPYLINAFADPEQCYRFEEMIHENRVKKVFKELDSLTYNLRSHEEAKWKMLTDHCIQIFKKDESE